MSTAFTVLRRQRRRRPPSLRRTGLGCGLWASLFLAAAAFALVAGYMAVTADLPSLDSLPVELDPETGRLYQPTRLYDRTGEHLILALENPAATGRQALALESSALDSNQANFLPETLVSATLAASEPDFWQSPGYRLAELSQDTHPTLAQQLAYELLLKQEPPGLRRNLRERLLAAQMIYRFGRQQILVWYLNTARYGPWIYGADAAARIYFGIPAASLNLAQAAFLAAMTENPQSNAWSAPPGVLERQQNIIQAMLVQGRITSDQALQAMQESLNLQPETPLLDLAPSFTQLVLAQLARRFPGVDLERGGWKIITTLDYTLQLQAECTANVQLARLQAQPEPTAARDGSPCKAAQLLPTLPAENLGVAENVAAGVVLLGPQQGQILAITGSVGSPRPGGTLLAPIVYLSAFSRGYGPASLVWDIPSTQPAQAEPQNMPSEPVKYLGPLRLRMALANDVLRPAETLASQLGSEVLLLTASQLGLASLTNPANLPAAGSLIQDGQVSLLEAAVTYSIFSNNGRLAGQVENPVTAASASRLTPASVIRLEDYHQALWLDWSAPQEQPVISTQLAYLMNHVLSDEPARWQSLGHPNPLEIGRPAGAKLGVTANGLDSWAVGYTPQFVAAVWLGKTGLTPAAIPTAATAGLWHALIQYASQGAPVQAWDIPAGVSTIEVCDPSGMLPTPSCPTIVSEVFLTGSEPTQADTLYRPFQVNRETGSLATVFTPPELVEEKVYLVVPPEAAGWAAAAGLPTPPDTYDGIYLTESSTAARLDDPAMFAHVHGKVTFSGSAGGADFAFYRLQVGQGLNPQGWTQLGEDADSPVTNGVLGEWDTGGLSGLYAVQLLVVNQDQRVERALLQVTVDNEPPQVQIVSPASGQETTFSSTLSLVLQASVQDNLEISRVEFYIDRELVASLSQAPYLISWQAARGEHTLLVRAFDLAGNESETAVKFTVK